MVKRELLDLQKKKKKHKEGAVISSESSHRNVDSTRCFKKIEITDGYHRFPHDENQKVLLI